ncbi:predicted protein [Postia placenta Mad-698-R]|nr:predicted protein [Postia placenta Mad-698-R]
MSWWANSMDDLKHRVEKVEREATRISQVIPPLVFNAQSLKERVDEYLRFDMHFLSAWRNLQTVMTSVEELYVAEQASSDTSSLVAKCKQQSLTSARGFRMVHETLKTLLRDTNTVSVEAVKVSADGESALKSIDDAMSIAHVIRRNVTNLKQIQEQKLSVAHKAVEDANDTVAKLKEVQSDAELKKDVRGAIRWTPFFLGPGPLIVSEIVFANAKRDLAKANEQLRSAESARDEHCAMLSAAQSQLDSIHEQLSNIDGLRGRVQKQISHINNSRKLSIRLKGEVSSVRNAALDLSLILSTFAAKSEPLATKYSARGFADNIRNIAQFVSGADMSIRGTPGEPPS